MAQPKSTSFFRSILAAVGFCGVLLLAILTLFFAALVIGENQERKRWHEAPSTLHLYDHAEVCAIHQKTSEILTKSIPARDGEGTDDEWSILNCGACGACSNVNDVAIYHHTRRTLTLTMTMCAREGFVAGLVGGDVAQVTDQCFQKAAGISGPCSKCWTDNALCNFENCLATCIKGTQFPFLPSLYGHELDQSRCHACDERLCGPAFIECSGANRRRTGVVSDIKRDDEKELCTRVDMDWILQAASNGETWRSRNAREAWKEEESRMEEL